MTAIAATSTAAPATASATAKAATAQASLGNNYQTFLKLLMTQLKNQDPTSPLDTNQFTSQLVQYSSVEQQINMNSNLGQLIQLSQTNGILQSAALVGRTVAVDADQVSVQSGKAALSFNAPTAGPVNVAVYDSRGVRLTETTMDAAQGSNNWTWDGKLANGNTVADGAYRAIVKTAPTGGGTGSELPFTVLARATGVQQNGSNLQVDLGALAVKMSAVRSIMP